MKRMIDDKIINKLSIKNDVLEIDGTVNATKITGDEIVENMSGYTASMGSKTGWSLEKVYIGACKNGNKVTFVVALNITKTDNDAGQNFTLATINIPSSIGSKLYSTQVGAYTFLDNKKIPAFDSFISSTDVYVYVRKESDTELQFRLGTGTFTTDIKYYLRYEVTFLLSDDLIS